MQTTQIGNRAEQAAANYLERADYEIIMRNWRRRDCEIDIVARKASVICLVEVKYRSSDVAGSGIEYIAHDKLRQMAYAAERWVSEHGWRGEYMLAAIEVSGEHFEVTAFVDDIY